MSEAVSPVQYWRPSAALAPYITGYHSYRAALPQSEAFAIMERQVGSAIDPECFAALRRLA